MEENLINLISKLSLEIVRNEEEKEEEFDKCSPRNKYLLQQVAQKGFDVLLGKRDVMKAKDPCQTDYGANWDPSTLILDYGMQLHKRGDDKSYQQIIQNVHFLNQQSFASLHDLFKFLLLMKGPFVKHDPVKHAFSFTGSDFFFGANCDPFVMIPRDYASDHQTSPCKSKSLVSESMLHHDNWTNSSGSGFLLLDKLSDKCFNSIVSSNSHRSLLSDTCNNAFDSMLLDTFVENPIAHKLPGATVQNTEGRVCRSKSGNKNGGHREPLPELGEEKSSVWDFYEKEIAAESKDGSFLESIDRINKRHASNLKIGTDKKSESEHESCGNSLLQTPKDVVLSLWQQELGLVVDDRPRLRIVESSEYVQDVKYLLTGIVGQTFKFDVDKDCFYMSPGTCMEGIPPESLSCFSREFLQIGTCYVKLERAATKNGKNGTKIINQAFWKSIFQFLEQHYNSVLEIPASSNLLALKRATRKMHWMMTALSNICNELPRGGRLLSYLIEAAEKTSKKCVRQLLFGILESCCQIYLLWLLQNWMFRGHVEKHCSSDFFVEHEETPKDRSYYLSFHVHPGKIPSFLQDFQEMILNCGKTVHLLKLFNPQNEFCQMLEQGKYPKMRLCLSEEELNGLERELSLYLEEATKIAGPKVTVKTLQSTEKEKQELYELYVKTTQKELSVEREHERRKKWEETRSDKEEKRKLLARQTEFAKAEKKRKKLEREAETRKIENEMEKMKRQETNILEEEKVKMKNYYDRLLYTLEKRESRAKWRKSRLLLFEKRLAFFSEDRDLDRDENENVDGETSRNDNETFDARIDSEGNVVNLNLINRDLANGNVMRREIYTSAKEEAKKNKLKILATEFGFSSNRPENEIRTNKRKVGQNESNNKKKCVTENSTFRDSESEKALDEEEEKCVVSDGDGDSRSDFLSASNENPTTNERNEAERENSKNGLEFRRSFSFLVAENESTSSVCAETDSTHFTKYLKKSILLPLKIQQNLGNRVLLAHFLTRENFLSHLNSLRCYFFLNDGEFGRRLTENVFKTLSKCSEPARFFERSNLKNIMNEALNYTIHNGEPNVRHLSFKIVEMPKFLNHSCHDVLSPFELTYRVKWPLNIILTEKALAKYKIIFQFLLKLKRMSWTLNENFLYLTCCYKDEKIKGRVLINSPHYHKMQIYRHAMAQFIITLEDYVYSNGIQFPWINLMQDLEKAQNLDHLYQKHVRYIKDVLKRCFLTKHSRELMNCMENLMESGFKYHYTCTSSQWILQDGKYTFLKFQLLRSTFNEFCNLTKEFLRILHKKVSTNPELKIHYILFEKLSLILSKEK